MRIKKILKNNWKLIVGLIVGIIISVPTVYAATILFASNEVSYDNTTSGLTSTNVQDALDELYEKATPAGLLNGKTQSAGGSVFAISNGTKGYACNTNINGKTICVINGPANNTTDYNARVSALKTACTAVGGSFYSGRSYANCHVSSYDFDCIIRTDGYAICRDNTSDHTCTVIADGSVNCN